MRPLQIKGAEPVEAIKHWFRGIGFGCVDIHDVLTKLSLIHGVGRSWLILPFRENFELPHQFQNKLGKIESSVEYIVLPAGTETHWTMILVCVRSRRIEYWDSYKSSYTRHHRLIVERLALLKSALERALGGSGKWQIVEAVTARHQAEDRNCGLYAVRFMEQRMRRRTAESVASDLDYDIESVKSRYHFIRCSHKDAILANPRGYWYDRFRSRTTKDSNGPWKSVLTSLAGFLRIARP